jgi:VWFA-related protein
VDGPHGRPVLGLIQDDFLLYEDGKRQEIISFSTEPVPLSAAILIDDGLIANAFRRVQNSVAALASAFNEKDEVTVYRFNNYIKRLVDFTSDIPLAQQALSTLQDVKTWPAPWPNPTVMNPFSPDAPRINGAPIAPSAQIGFPIPSPDNRTTLNDVIFTAATELASRPADRRKIIFVISDGRNGQNEHSFNETVNLLLAEGIQVYAVGMDFALIARHMTALDSYTSETGGAACFVEVQRALENCYTDATVRARNQYVLGYISNNPAPANGPVFRNIDVQVPEKPYRVRHPKGYFQSR